MKILHICARLPFPVEDGGSVYVYNSIKQLSELGHEITIASFESELHNQDISGLTDISKVYTAKGEFTDYNFVSVLKSTFTRRPITIQHRMSISIMSKILSRIDSDFDIVIFEGLHTLNFFELIQKYFPNTKTLLRHVNVEFELISQRAYQQNNPLLKFFLFDQARLMKKFEIESLKKVDGITFISNLDQRKLEDNIKIHQPTLVNPPGAPTTNEINFEKRPNNHLIAFSNWKWPPNLEGLKWFLQKVWPIIYNANPDVKFTIAGNDLPTSISEQLPSNIKYIGFVNDLSGFNENSTIQVIPLISGSGVKLKVVEGLSYGNPIISTKFGIDGIEAQTGFHIELANNEVEFSNKVISLLENRSKRKQLSKNAHQLVIDKYSWPKQIKVLSEFINYVVSN